MPEFDYTGIRDTVVQPLTSDFGKTGTLKVPGAPTGPAYNPTPGDDVDHAVTLVQTKLRQSDIDGTVVQATDSVFLVSPEGLSIEPAMKQRLVVDGAEYQVVKVEPLKPGSVTMMWRVFARK